MASEKRLIDAVALVTTLNKLTELLKKGEIGEIDLDLIIAAMPTEDAVEVVHGRWIGDGWGSYIKRCSVCRSVPLREVGGRHDARYSNYCPNCGAKMDKNENP